jgi:hypothetical protein
MPDDLDSDLQATAEDIAADAADLSAIEAEKATLEATDPRMLELSAKAEALARRLTAKTVAEHDIAIEAAQGAD